MNRDIKYIKFDAGGEPNIVMWTDIFSVSHSSMAMMLNQKPVSAGFVRFRDGVAECYGKSVSLDIESDPADSAIVNEFAVNTH